MKNKPKKRKGFTLVELLATITILGVLLITVLVSYNNYLKNAKERYMKAQEDAVTLSGKEFFTDYRSALPQTIGDKESVTITELNSKKYLSKLTDYNGKQCAPSNDTNYNKVYAYKVMDGVYLYYTLLDCNGYKTNEDIKGPTITFNPNKADINKDLNVIMTAKDNKKVEYYSYEIEKDGIVISSESYKPYNGSVTITLKDEGTYVITGHAIDSSGNVTNKKSGKYVIDKTAPDCSKIQISSTNGSRPGVWQTKDVILKIMPHSDIDKWSINSCIKLKSNGSACTRIGSNLVGTKTKTLKGVYDSSLSNNKGRENGQVYALITAYDAVGNSCNIRTDSYLIDKDPPTINSSSIRSRTSSFNSLKTIINLSISDRGDSNNKIYYKIYDSLKGNSAWTEYVPVTATVGVRFNYDLAGNYDGGVRTIYIRAKDELGNISDKKKITYTVYKACDNKISNTTTGPCSASTGFGQATITTTYTDKFFSSISCGTTTSQTSCCVAPAVSYSDWGNCSKSCGGGLQYRIKTTTACDGTVTKTQESQTCNLTCCKEQGSQEFDAWGACSASCGGGLQYRNVRTYNCDGTYTTTTQSQACNTQSCCTGPTVTYSDWGACSASCGGGLQYRTKYTKNCDGTVTESQESQACNSHDCCSSVYYTDSSECSQSCGGGTKKQIAHSNYNGQLCPNQNKNSGGAACNTQDCCSSVSYSDSTECSKKCGGGTKKQLATSTYNGQRCPDKDKASGGAACNTQGCCTQVKSDWNYGNYGDCKLFKKYQIDQTNQRRQKWQLSKYNGTTKCNKTYEYKSCSYPTHTHVFKLVSINEHDYWGTNTQFTCGCSRSDGYKVRCEICGAYAGFHICPVHWNANGYHT